jgi:ubiquitin carboxyl-terminal hydrolase 4/11/15
MNKGSPNLTHPPSNVKLNGSAGKLNGLASEAVKSPYTDKEIDDTECLYDLYAVANHLGGMSGGHYTAFVKCESEGNTMKDMINSNTTEEDITPATGVFDGSNIRVTDSGGNWMCFDDDVVTAVPVDALESTIVTEAAYVLFYRRRQLTSSNIINLSS